jgi:hypothetical protein
LKLSKIETNLYDLLLKKNEEVVISISGEWGVGKTFFWNNFISKKYQTDFKNKKIAYVSLFGIDSLSDIRTSILLQASPAKNKISFINKKVFTPFKNLKSSLKLDDVSMSFGLNSLSSILTLLTSGDFKDVIICIDDFERMSSKIDFKDILGLISELKEQKECKIILILNEQELSKLSNIEKKSYSEIFSLYREKIIDYNFKFEPSTEESVLSATQRVKSKFDTNDLITHFTKFNVKNIRVIQQVIRQLSNFEFIINKNFDQNVLNEFFNTALPIFLYFVKDGKSTENYFKEKSKYDVSKMSDEEFEKINFDEWKKSIFVGNDELIEIIILEFIDTHTVRSEKLIEILTTKNKNLDRYIIQKTMTDNWHKLHIDFKYKIIDFINDTKLVFETNKDNLQYILNIDDFHHYVSFMRENGEKIDDTFEEAIIKQFIDLYVQQEKSISVHEQYKQDFIKEYYPQLISYWNEKKQAALIDSIDISKLEELLIKTKTGWGNKDEYILNNIEVNLFKQYIIESASFTKNLIKFVNSHKDDTTYFYTAISNIKEAFISLRQENNDYKFKIDKIVKEYDFNLK